MLNKNLQDHEVTVQTQHKGLLARLNIQSHCNLCATISHYEPQYAFSSHNEVQAQL